MLKEISSSNFPNTRFGYHFRTSRNSQLIYITTLASILILFIVLPFINITISIKGTGQIASAFEKVDIVAPVSGRIIEINLTENQQVNKNDLLLKIDASHDKNQMLLLENNLTTVNSQREDLNELLTFKTNLQLKTNLYKASWQQFRHQLLKANGLIEQCKKNYDKFSILAAKKVVSTVEFEEHRFNYDQAVLEQEILIKTFKKQWEIAAEENRNAVLKLLNQKKSLRIDAELLSLKATTAGSIQGTTGLRIGSYVFADQKIGEISPDSNLLAICYLKPTNIGLIAIKQLVNFQLDAFNYNQWGILVGHVLEISKDLVTINSTPYVKVKCVINKHEMHLKNGYRGRIRKGMTFTANFFITERSLFQLIYDKVDDWVNPSRT